MGQRQQHEQQAACVSLLSCTGKGSAALLLLLLAFRPMYSRRRDCVISVTEHLPPQTWCFSSLVGILVLLAAEADFAGHVYVFATQPSRLWCRCLMQQLCSWFVVGVRRVGAGTLLSTPHSWGLQTAQALLRLLLFLVCCCGPSNLAHLVVMSSLSGAGAALAAVVLVVAMTALYWLAVSLCASAQ